MDFDFKPYLEGKHLCLRPLAKGDFDTLFSVAKDPHIWAQHPIKDRYKKTKFTEYFCDAMDSNSALIAIDSKTHNVIGSSRFHAYSRKKSEVEIGWSFLARPYWGGVYNGEMKNLMLKHAFQYVENVVFIIGIHNLRSQKATKKIGGILSEEENQQGESDNVIYHINRADYFHE